MFRRVEAVCLSRDRLVGAEDDVAPPGRAWILQDIEQVGPISIELGIGAVQPGAAAAVAQRDEQRQEIDAGSELGADGLRLGGEPPARVRHNQRYTDPLFVETTA